MKISIITINFNNELGLKKTLQSIREQSESEYELIVIDNMSIDESNKVILENNDLISKSIIEKDRGISDAYNKGLVNSTSDYLLYLNSGDYFNSKYSLGKLIENIEDKDFIIYDLYHKREDKIIYRSIKFTPYKLKYTSTYPLPSVILSKKFLINNKLYFNLKLKNTMDTDILLRAIKLSKNYLYINHAHTVMPLGGVSEANIRTTIKEGYLIRYNNIGLYSALIFSFLRYIKYFIKVILCIK